jgi:hypothetical protein
MEQMQTSQGPRIPYLLSVKLKRHVLLEGLGEARTGAFDPCLASRCSCLDEVEASSRQEDKLIVFL